MSVDYLYINENDSCFPETTLFLGNGFDLDLGLKTKYTDFFSSRGENGYWPIHNDISAEEHLYKRLNGDIIGSSMDKDVSYRWYDLENELKEHAKRQVPKGVQNVKEYQASFDYDQKYFKEIKKGLKAYLKYEVERWGKKDHEKAQKTVASQLMQNLYVNAKVDPNIITFNYTNINSLMYKCRPSVFNQVEINPDKIQHVHGSLAEDHIILGINEECDIPKEYDFLYKSWDEYYGSHRVIDTLKNSQIIMFFGLSFGSIDSVYFVDFFKSIINGTYDSHKKLIVIFTYNETSIHEIYRNLLSMDISIMELKAHCDFRMCLTNPNNPIHPHSFSTQKFESWLNDYAK